MTEVVNQLEYVEAPKEAPGARKKEVDDLVVMNRIKALMGLLPKGDQVRVAKWTAERWG